MSGADAEVEEDVPARPPLTRSSVAGSLRRAAIDFYYNSVRLIAANALWGAVVLVLSFVATFVGLLAAVLLAPLLGLPLVGVYRLAGHITRGQEVVLADVGRAARERFVSALVLAAAISWAAVLLLTNVRLGLGSGSALGVAFATVAGWGLVALACFAVVVWPLLADPDRRNEPATALVRLAGYALLARPARIMLLSAVAVVLGIVSTVAFAAIVTITVAYLALASCRVVLPDADDLAEGLTARTGQ